MLLALLVIEQHPMLQRHHAASSAFINHILATTLRQRFFDATSSAFQRIPRIAARVRRHRLQRTSPAVSPSAPNPRSLSVNALQQRNDVSL